MKTDLINFDHPLSDVPHLDHLLGVWAVSESTISGLVSMFRSFDLGSHLAARSAAGPLDGPISYRTDSNGVAVISIMGTMQKHSASLGSSCSTVMVRRDTSAKPGSIEDRMTISRTMERIREYTPDKWILGKQRPFNYQYEQIAHARDLSPGKTGALGAVWRVVQVLSVDKVLLSFDSTTVIVEGADTEGLVSGDRVGVGVCKIGKPKTYNTTFGAKTAHTAELLSASEAADFLGIKIASYELIAGGDVTGEVLGYRDGKVWIRSGEGEVMKHAYAEFTQVAMRALRKSVDTVKRSLK